MSFEARREGKRKKTQRKEKVLKNEISKQSARRWLSRHQIQIGQVKRGVGAGRGSNFYRQYCMCVKIAREDKDSK